MRYIHSRRFSVGPNASWTTTLISNAAAMTADTAAIGSTDHSPAPRSPAPAGLPRCPLLRGEVRIMRCPRPPLAPRAASTSVFALNLRRRSAACGVRKADAAWTNGLGAPLSSVVCRDMLGQISSGNVIQFFKLALCFRVIGP
jgi:hypothetical protein